MRLLNVRAIAAGLLLGAAGMTGMNGALLGMTGTIPAQEPAFGGAAAYVADLAARRAKMAAALGPASVLVLWSAPSRVYSADINYPYRQDSNLLYLSGLHQEETILVIVPGARGAAARVFTRAGDPLRELWYGHTLTAAEVTAQSGIADVVEERGEESFDTFMARLLSPSPDEDTEKEFPEFVEARRAGHARLGIAARLGPPNTGDQTIADSPEAKAHAAWALDEERQHPGVRAFDATPLLAAARQVKTPYEQALLRRSVEISVAAQRQAMLATRPGRWEYEVESAFEATYLRLGALTWGYPPIVASGPNATTLHYEASTREMRSGDLLLIDAAANYQDLTGDITRTYPVNGRFTPAQRALYTLVLAAQNAGIAAAHPGGRVEDITNAVRAVFADGLRRLGLVTAPFGEWDEERQVALWFPHGPTHGIGLDVHDPLSGLPVGAAFVVEPGLYIRPDTLDNLPDTVENAALRAALRGGVARFRNLGVRIEDSFLMTATGPEMLSAALPRQIADLERTVGGGR